jgi:hypothetical protein
MRECRDGAAVSSGIFDAGKIVILRMLQSAPRETPVE